MRVVLGTTEHLLVLLSGHVASEVHLEAEGHGVAAFVGLSVLGVNDGLRLVEVILTHLVLSFVVVVLVVLGHEGEEFGVAAELAVRFASTSGSSRAGRDNAGDCESCESGFHSWSVL